MSSKTWIEMYAWKRSVREPVNPYRHEQNKEIPMTYGVRLKVEGDYALFTRPETKAERSSYDVMTPSAARGILEAIHFKPAIRWVIDKIHVLNPIRFDSIRRNEVRQKALVAHARRAMKSGETFHLVADEGDMRQQRSSLILRDVAYVIEAHFELTVKAGKEDNEGKHLDIFNRRAASGQCFQQPYFGCREFPARFSLLSENEQPVSQLAHDADRDLGWMLYDIDYANHMTPLFYKPKLEKGVIDVARWRKETVCS